MDRRETVKDIIKRIESHKRLEVVAEAVVKPTETVKEMIERIEKQKSISASYKQELLKRDPVPALVIKSIDVELPTVRNSDEQPAAVIEPCGDAGSVEMHTLICNAPGIEAEPVLSPTGRPTDDFDETAIIVDNVEKASTYICPAVTALEPSTSAITEIDDPDVISLEPSSDFIERDRDVATDTLEPAPVSYSVDPQIDANEPIKLSSVETIDEADIATIEQSVGFSHVDMTLKDDKSVISSSDDECGTVTAVPAQDVGSTTSSEDDVGILTNSTVVTVSCGIETTDEVDVVVPTPTIEVPTVIARNNNDIDEVDSVIIEDDEGVVLIAGGSPKVDDQTTFNPVGINSSSPASSSMSDEKNTVEVVATTVVEEKELCKEEPVHQKECDVLIAEDKPITSEVNAPSVGDEVVEETVVNSEVKDDLKPSESASPDGREEVVVVILEGSREEEESDSSTSVMNHKENTDPLVVEVSVATAVLTEGGDGPTEKGSHGQSSGVIKSLLSSIERKLSSSKTSPTEPTFVDSSKSAELVSATSDKPNKEEEVLYKKPVVKVHGEESLEDDDDVAILADVDWSGWSHGVTGAFGFLKKQWRSRKDAKPQNDDTEAKKGSSSDTEKGVANREPSAVAAPSKGVWSPFSRAKKYFTPVFYAKNKYSVHKRWSDVLLFGVPDDLECETISHIMLMRGCYINRILNCEQPSVLRSDLDQAYDQFVLTYKGKAYIDHGFNGHFTVDDEEGLVVRSRNGDDGKVILNRYVGTKQVVTCSVSGDIRCAKCREEVAKSRPKAIADLKNTLESLYYQTGGDSVRNEGQLKSLVANLLE